jgi:hypothetical protein
MATKHQPKGLDNRGRDKDGEIRHKRRDTLVETLRKEYGEGFAKGFGDRKTLGDVLKKTGAQSLHEVLKKKL